MKHSLDYRRDVQSNMTVCGLVVGDEFIVEEDEAIECPDCSQLGFRRDEPENEVGIPDAEGMKATMKQERYGD
jgi:hypothetical protein